MKRAKAEPTPEERAAAAEFFKTIVKPLFANLAEGLRARAEEEKARAANL